MKRIYKTDFGSLANIGFAALMFLSFTILSFFAFGGAPLGIRIGTSIATVFFVYFFFTMLKYDAIITDDAIYTKQPLLSFLNKYQSMKFEDVGEVFHAIGPFPEQTAIFLRSHRDKKLISFLVGFGLPWDALLDVLERLPKDVKITFEPELWKRIKKPLTDAKVRRINKIAAVVILLSILWFSYFLVCVFKWHRVPFPINVLIGEP